MNNYKFGKHLEMEEVLENKEKWAKIFSEGNEELEQLLLNLWQHNIDTYMCCTGHEYGDTPYIVMYIPFENKEMIYKIINSIYNEEHVLIKLGKEYQKKELMIDIRSYVSPDFFAPINNSLNKEVSKNEINKEIIKAVELLSNFSHDNYDLYWDMINNNGVKKHSAYLNYTTIKENDPTCHLYVLQKKIKTVATLDSPLFSDRKLDEVASEYKIRK